MLINRLNSHYLRSSSLNPLTLPFFNTKSNGFRLFAHAAPFLWNHLPKIVRSAPTYLPFRKRLKTYFFNQAFATKLRTCMRTSVRISCYQFVISCACCARLWACVCACVCVQSYACTSWCDCVHACMSCMPACEQNLAMHKRVYVRTTQSCVSACMEAAHQINTCSYIEDSHTYTY